MNIEKMKWTCSTCKTEQKGGNRYSNHKGGTDCWKCTPTLNNMERFAPKGVEIIEVATRFVEDSGNPNISYVGKALAGTATSAPRWQIKKIDETSGVIITWANGSTAPDHIFDNRESLTYS